MEPTPLRYFRAIAAAGHLTRAARGLGFYIREAASVAVAFEKALKTVPRLPRP